MSDIRIEQRGTLGLITLDRPRALNALTTAMCQQMLDVLLAWRDDPQIHQVAVTGAGERGLCAGGDIVAIYRDINDREGSTEEFWRIEYQLNALIDEYPKPYIALMDGIVLGGGIGISAHGSHRVVTEASKCGMPEVSIGFFPDVGGTHLLARAPRSAGRYAALTGQSVGAADAIELGLADVHVEQRLLPQLLRELETLSADQVLNQHRSQPAPGILSEPWITAFEAAEPVDILQQLQRYQDPAAQRTAAALQRACPSSVDLVLALLQEAGSDLREDLRREFRAAVHRLDDPDFGEGIRAQVIDKDRSPQWVARVDGLSAQQRVARHLAPLAGRELDFELIEHGTVSVKE